MLFARWRSSALPLRARRVALALPLLFLLLAIWACSFSVSPVRPHVGVRYPPVTQLPDAKLALMFWIRGQYDGAADAEVAIQVGVFERENSGGSVEVELADSVRVTCNGGVGVRKAVGNLSVQCPRQPPGGSYRLAFTDARGAVTTVVVPVPPGTFAIVSPQDGASVPIPTNGALAVRYTMPIPPASGSVAVGLVTVSCNLTETTPCGVVYGKRQPNPPPTVSVTQSGQVGVILVAGDYRSFVPAPGILSITFEAYDTLDPGGFASVGVNYSDTLDAHITWTR